MNLLSPTFYVMIADMLFFNKDVKRYMEMEEDDPRRFISIRGEMLNDFVCVCVCFFLKGMRETINIF